MIKHLHFGLVCPKDIFPEVLWFDQMQLCKLCSHVLFRFRGKKLSPMSTLPNMLTHLFLIVLPWTLTRCVDCIIYSLASDIWVNLLGRPLLKTGNCLECFTLVNNLPQRRIMVFKMFGFDSLGIDSLRSLLMSFLLGIVLTHTWMLQTSKPPNRLCIYLIGSAWLLLMEAVMAYLVFHTWLLYFVLIFVKWIMTKSVMCCCSTIGHPGNFYK